MLAKPSVKIRTTPSEVFENIAKMIHVSSIMTPRYKFLYCRPNNILADRLQEMEKGRFDAIPMLEGEDLETGYIREYLYLGCSRVKSIYIYGFYVNISVKNYMVLQEETKIVQSRKAYTQYLIIPSAVVRDSQYPFKDGGRVRIKVDPKRKILVVTSP